MSNVPFYETRTGRTFYESTMPSLVAELAKLNSLLAQIIDRLQDRDTEGPRKP